MESMDNEKGAWGKEKLKTKKAQRKGKGKEKLKTEEKSSRERKGERKL